MLNESRGVLVVAALLAAGGAAFACRNAAPDQVHPTESGQPLPGPPTEWFVDHASETGLDFVHFNGMSGERYYAEHMGPGVALFDYDNDGDLDVFIPQG